MSDTASETTPSVTPETAVVATRQRSPATFQDRAEYYALRGIIGALGRLRWARATAIGGKIAGAGYWPLGIRRGVVERQIAAAFPEFDPTRVEAVARASYAHLGRTTLETALLPSLAPGAVLGLFDEPVGWDVLENARAAGRGVILVTGHLGNWELGGSYVAARGIPIDGIARGMSNPVFEDYLTATREAIGMRIVHDADAVRRTPRALRDNHVVAFVSDQGALGLASTYVPFFGRPAKTPRGPAVFALRLRVPVIFAAAIRQPSGRYRVTFEPVRVVDTGDRERDVEAIVLTYTQMLESWIRRYPEQYFWHHRRWRHQPADTPPELREP